MELSVIIPIFNEAGNIPLLYERLTKAVTGLVPNYEFIFVNDGSRDESIALVRELAGKDPYVRYIDLSRNFGHQVAVTAGLEFCQGKAAVIIDADLQDPPELIPDLYARMKEGFEVVYARRKERKGEGFLKKITARIFYRLLSRITQIDIPLDTGDFRIIDRKVINALKAMPEQHRFLRGQISWVGFRQTFLDYDRDERFAGKTGYTWGKMVRLAIDGITSFSDFPLKFATYAGFFVSGIAFLLIIYALYSRFILQDYEKGWASEIISILFIGGIQLIGIGVIGEYIARISSNTRQRPLFIVNETNIMPAEPEL